jgi:hypothetical protein
MSFGCFYLLQYIGGDLKNTKTMFTIFALYSPLEQFQILPLIPLYFGVLDVSITNEFIILSLIFIITILFYFTLLKTDTNTYFVIPLNEFL